MAEATNETQVEAKRAPTFHLLPLTLGVIANHADPKASGARFALQGVRVAFKGDTFTADATDAKQAVRVSGPCRSAEDYPVDSVPALNAAQNGETEAIIPADAWKKAFGDAAKLKGMKRLSGSLACVAGRNVTTFGATTGEVSAVGTATNLEGRFPPIDEIVAQTKRSATHKIRFDARKLAEVLKTACEFAPDGDAVTIEFSGSEKPVLVSTSNGEIDFTGLVMPLAD